VLDEIYRILPRDARHTAGLYELMIDYPLRHGKMLRPALAIASCRAFGGSMAAILPTAAALELYHNAFLIHDDVEDLSHLRRSEATLGRLYGAPMAINVGDGLLAVTMEPLLDNTARIGLGKALKILKLVARMARETAEGQMIELRWISEGAWTQRESDYTRLVHKKTSWYTFLAPVMTGAIVAGQDEAAVARAGRAVVALGVAFQIQDDVLNIAAEPDGYNKDLWGDLWEGKHTLILIHALAHAKAEERARAISILRKPPPPLSILSGAVARTAEDVAYLRDLAIRCGGVAHARKTAAVYARRSRRALAQVFGRLPPSPDRQFFFDVADFVILRST
jgi:geranylgeranyl diphosphate synthase type II